MCKKCLNMEVFSGLYFSVFSPNAGKQEPEKTPYLDTFHAVRYLHKSAYLPFLDAELVVMKPCFSQEKRSC